jgi:hypothetical protein
MISYNIRPKLNRKEVRNLISCLCCSDILLDDRINIDPLHSSLVCGAIGRELQENAGNPLTGYPYG